MKEVMPGTMICAHDEHKNGNDDMLLFIVPRTLRLRCTERTSYIETHTAYEQGADKAFFKNLGWRLVLEVDVKEIKSRCRKA